MSTRQSRIVITIDGLAGSGKTAVSRELAKRLDYRYLSSGLLYRAVGYLALKNQVSFDRPEDLLPILKNTEIKLEPTEDLNNKLILNGENVTMAALQPEVSEATSSLALHQLIRDYLLDMQKNAFVGENLIAEGRDMGTIIFPDAELKVFLTCSPEILVERRLNQILKNNPDAAESDPELLKKQLKIEIEERNHRDTTRDVAPTIPAVGALIIDNSQQTLTEVVNYVYNYATQNLCK